MHYTTRVTWLGNLGSGTETYAGYGRAYRVEVEGKPALLGSADPAFRGEADKHNPEQLFLAAISSCHMLTYLALCARSGIRVLDYTDDAQAVLRLEPGGGGAFEQVVLQPRVTVSGHSDVTRAAALHDEAHAHCFIARSCSVPVIHRPSIQRRGEVRP
jgi:organic hydroperoxide reductase OsmC/OhrA